MPTTRDCKKMARPVLTDGRTGETQEISEPSLHDGGIVLSLNKNDLRIPLILNAQPTIEQPIEEGSEVEKESEENTSQIHIGSPSGNSKETCTGNWRK